MKNKLIQNSKDILSRSFNSLKCKISLRMSVSRLKILKNKKEVQVKQMKKEIAQLLESGQDRTARIRVEHFVREEKMMAAYDLLELYCELIVSRLSIIESQKNIPIDLKEALASVIFASSRCGDVPELLDVRKHLTTKYGKEFTSKAIELRPDSGVGRMLVEKLSATAPDGPTKIKILSKIAEEHSVKWDLSSLEEKDLADSNDLLTGPNNFGSSSSLYAKPPSVESPVVQASSNNDKMDSPSLNVPQQHPSSSLRTENLSSIQTSGVDTSLSNNNMYSPSLNVPQQDPRASLATENLSSSQNHGIGTVQPAINPPGDNQTHLFQDDFFRSSLDKHKWNMKFEDAASAAQAAAESAERASIAARAAAELSNREKIMRQNSTESRNSDEHFFKGKGRDTYETSKLPGTEDSGNSSTFEETSLQKEQKYILKPDKGNTSGSFKENGGESKKYGQSASLKSKASEDYESMDHDVPAAGAKYWENSSKVPMGDVSRKKQFFIHDAESTNDRPHKFEEFMEDRVEKQPSVRSSSGDAENYVQSNSLKSKASSELKNHGAQAFDEYSTKKSSEVCRSEMAESTDKWPEKPEEFREELIGRLPSVKFSQSHSNISDDVNIFADSVDQKFEHNAYDGTAVVIGRGSFNGEVLQTRYDEPDGAVYDKSGLDSENHGIYLGFMNDEKHSVSHYPSKSFEHLSKETDSWSSRSESRKMMKPNSPTLFSGRKNSFSGLSENLSKDGSELNEIIPPKFDCSDGSSSESDNDTMSRHILDGLSSESDEEMIPSRLSVMENSKTLPNTPGDLGESSQGNEYLETGIKQSSLFSDDELKSNKMLKDINHGTSDSPKKFRIGKLSSQPASRPNEFQAESSDSETKFSSEIGEGLNFGKLTGGLRQKGNNRPPYMNKVGGLSSEPEKITVSSIVYTSPTDVESPKNNKTLILEESNSPPPVYSDTDSDSSEEEESLQKKSHHMQGRIFRNTGKQVKMKTGLKGRNSFFDSDQSDLDEDDPKESHSKKTHQPSNISRRTKLTLSSKQNSSAKEREETEMSVISETLLESVAQVTKSMKWENNERPTSDKVASMPPKSKFWVPPEKLTSEKETNVKMHKSKTKLQPGSLDLDASNGRGPVYTPHKESQKQPSETEERNPLTLHSYDSPRKNNEKGGSYKHPTSSQESSKPAKSSTKAASEDPKVTFKPNQTNNSKTSAPTDLEKVTPVGANKDKVIHISSASEQLSKIGASVSSDSPRAPTMSLPNNSGSPRKAAHVHPKLPDYDSLVHALRKDRS